MIKHDDFQRALVRDIISRFNQKGFKLVGMKLTTPGKEMFETWFWVVALSLMMALSNTTTCLLTVVRDLEIMRVRKRYFAPCERELESNQLHC